MDWLEDEDGREAALLEQLSNPNTIKDLTLQQRAEALVIATRQRNGALSKLILRQGSVNPNTADEFGCSAVMFAASCGLHDCLESLLSMPNCVINKRSNSMQTALHFAAKKGQVKCVELLINNGAMVNVADDWGETPLMLGVRAGCVSTVHMLLDNGARLEMINLRGMDALTYAAQGGFLDIMQVLLSKGFDVNIVGKLSPLHQAALFGHVSCVQLLLDHGAQPDIRDIHGILPIELATQTDKHMVVKCLIDHGTSNEYKNLALTAAAKNNGIRSSKMLLYHGADPGAVDMQGLPALFWAVAQNNAEITKCLIRHNVDVNKTLSRVYIINSEFRDLISELDLECIDAVVLAALREYCKIVQVLVLAGASPFVVLRLWELGQLSQAISSIISWLAHINTRPRSLAFLCRKSIRETMFTTGCHQIRELPLPRPIQDYLHFADLTGI